MTAAEQNHAGAHVAHIAEFYERLRFRMIWNRQVSAMRGMERRKVVR